MALDIKKIKVLYPNAVKNVIDVLALELDNVNWSDLNKIHFLAQVAHESGGFRYLKENLNYSAEGLIKTFPRYFKNTHKDPYRYARHPDMIADVVYAHRMGNGDELSHDGSKYKGRGLIQVTGKYNYTKCLEFLGKSDPAYLESVEGAVKSAIWFWSENNLQNEYNLTNITKRINGGLNGLDDRNTQFTRIRKVLVDQNTQGA